MTMSKEEWDNYYNQYNNNIRQRVTPESFRRMSDSAYANYLAQTGNSVNIPVVNQNPQQPAINPGVVGTYRTNSGKGGGDVTRVADWLKRFREGNINFNGPTGGAAPVEAYGESLDKIAFNPTWNNLYSKIRGETPEEQRQRLIEHNVKDRMWIDANYGRYPQFYRDIINPMFERDIQERTQFLRDNGFNT